MMITSRSPTGQALARASQRFLEARGVRMDATRESSSGDVIDRLEARISAARLTRAQKDRLRRLAATAIHNAKDARKLPDLIKGLNAMVEAWEVASREPGESEDPQRTKRIKDYLRELREQSQAVGEASAKVAAAREAAREAARAPRADASAPRPAERVATATASDAAAPAAADATAGNTPRIDVLA